MNMETFYQSLAIMGQGMAGIFVVIVVFYGMIVGLTKLMPPEHK